ncbi:phage tail assembly chaperone [Pseudomonas fakonensis]|uniref:Phage tail assembly chaperone n=1 Tax=Pseudomonas fakonensis TaxID=2842355 RepID=A0ABX8NDW9_9PSED|nr:phage tail assembly chaperone [Pseudomonas fakonensis]
MMDIERTWRDVELSEWVWLRDRHRDQREIGTETSLDSAQFTELLTYLQQLRDWPQSEAFPKASERPQAPQFLEQFGGDQ